LPDANAIALALGCANAHLAEQGFALLHERFTSLEVSCDRIASVTL